MAAQGPEDIAWRLVQASALVRQYVQRSASDAEWTVARTLVLPLAGWEQRSLGDFAAKLGAFSGEATASAWPPLVGVSVTEHGGVDILERIPAGTSLPRFILHAESPASTASALESRTTSGLDGSAVRALLTPLARGLEALHQVGLAHGTLRPSAVWVSSAAAIALRPHLAAAAYTQDPGLRFPHARWEALHPEPHWMAPEHLEGATLSPSVDVYGWAALAYYALTGSSPIPAGPALRVFEALRGRRFRSLAERREDVDADFTRMLEAALAARPEDRPRLDELCPPVAAPPVAWPNGVRAGYYGDDMPTVEEPVQGVATPELRHQATLVAVQSLDAMRVRRSAVRRWPSWLSSLLALAVAALAALVYWLWVTRR